MKKDVKSNMNGGERRMRVDKYIVLLVRPTVLQKGSRVIRTPMTEDD